MTTAQKTWTAGDILTAADMNTYARGGQEMGFAAISTTSATFTTEADITGLSVTWTAIASRSYRLEFSGNARSTVASDLVGVFITDSANNHVAESFVSISAANRAEGVTVVARVTGASGSVTYKVRGILQAGSGTPSISAVAGRPAQLWVTDVGAA